MSRLLLSIGADLDYKNFRPWTSISFLWAPERPRLTHTSEILEICSSQNFSAWNDTDTRGWTPTHRAAAYGSGEDIRNLDCKDANIRSYTTDHLWGPITCSVWNSNESTFDILVDLLRDDDIIDIKDSRGWTLLHLAAQKGSKYILKRLLELGAGYDTLTVGTSDWVTENLEHKTLTAEDIACEYGHVELWNQVM